MLKNHKLLMYIGFLLLLVGVGSCKKMDDYKQYIADKPVITYTGKIDSVKVFSGNNRVVVQGLLTADPKIVEARIYWDNRRDSLVLPIQRTANVDTIRAEITNLEDRIYNFDIVTYDNQGNKSVKVPAFGRSYGENYKISLINRPVENARLFVLDNQLTASFGNIDLTTGIFATEISYTDIEGGKRTQRLPINEKVISIDQIDGAKEISFRSLYLPDTLCIDTFYTQYSPLQPQLFFYKNLGYPFTATNISGRWGVLEHWESNAAANAIGGRGSWDNNTGVGVLSAEAGWGTPNINNGKIHQTSTLPAGSYEVVIEFRRNNVTGNVDATNNLIYFVATDNGDIPDVAAVESATALGYYNLSWIGDDYQTISFRFDNPTAQQVTIGFVTNLMSSSNQFFNVRGLTVFKVEE